MEIFVVLLAFCNRIWNRTEIIRLLFNAHYTSRPDYTTQFHIILFLIFLIFNLFLYLSCVNLNASVPLLLLQLHSPFIGQ